MSESCVIKLTNNFLTPCCKAKQYVFLRRLLKFRHMDFEYALWQAWYLFVNPQKVYRNFQYRKNYANQFASDDPAFLLLVLGFLVGSTLGFSLLLGLGLTQTVQLLAWVLLVDCVMVCLLATTIIWAVCNWHLLHQKHDSLLLEWGYVFDVQLYAYFPLMVVLHLCQLPFLFGGLILRDSVLSVLLGNSFWLLAFLYYFYIAFLGFKGIPSLHKSKMFLYPLTVVIVVYVLSVFCGWNVSRSLCIFYQYRLI